MFDRERQHVVAEATAETSLRANEYSKQQSEPQPGEGDHDKDNFLWLCGTAIPRSFGICEHVLVSSAGASHGTNALTPGLTARGLQDLPVSVVPDLANDPRFQNRPYIHGCPFNRFYAGVPIRTPGPNGVNIGVYCIFDKKPRPQGLTSDEVKFMQDISRTTMGYLECRASSGRYRRSERMVRGMGNFVEGLDSLAPVGGAPGRRTGHAKRSSRLIDLAEVASGVRKSAPISVRPKRPEALPKSISGGLRTLDESLLSPRSTHFPSSSKDLPASNKGSPLLEPSSAAGTAGSRQSMSLAPDDSSRCSTPQPESRQSENGSPRPTVLSQVSTADLERVESGHVFAKAANIVRQSLDIDGVLFLDATVRSFGGLVGQQSDRKVSAVGLENLNYISNDEDATSQTPTAATREGRCNVLGYSTKEGSSIMGDRPPWQFDGMQDRTLQRLLRRYPHGRIFNFDENGERLQPHVSVDRDPPTPGVPLTPGIPLTPGLPPKRPVSPTRQWSRDSQDPDDLRSAAITGTDKLPTTPKQRWNPAESIIRLFPGARSVIIIPLWDGQKKRWVAGGFVWTNSHSRIFTSDGTLSFLRVFGLVVMAEIHRLSVKADETIKSNILGSISHELRSPLHGLVGAVELLHDSNLDAVQQNVLNIVETSGKTLVDTIGHLLDYSKINSFIESDKKESMLGKVGSEPNHRAKPSSVVTTELDCLCEEVVESVLAGFFHERTSGPRRYNDAFGYSQPASAAPGDGVRIYLDIEPAASWRFRAHPGAFRRIVMNLFGNSLKFTKFGFIKISLTQEAAKPYEQNSRASVLLTVADSGKGISEEYLLNNLFTPFCQEDHFAPGTGLGLSLVRQIAVNLGGEVKVASQVGRGTTITVSLPLPNADETPELEEPTGSKKDIRRLKGKKVLLRGLEGVQSLENFPGPHAGGLDDVGKLLESQAHILQNTCRDWLQMKVLSDSEGRIERPDFIIHHDSALSFRDAESIAVKSPCPVLFVCEPSVAVKNFSWNLPDAASRIRTFEFFSPPLGPRKLAKGLVHLLEMWKVKQQRNEPVHHTTSVEVLPTSKENRKNQSMSGKDTILSAQEVEYGNGITLVKSTRASLVATQTVELKTLPLPTPPEDRAEPVATTTVVVGDHDKPEGPYVLIVDDNAINLKVCWSNSPRKKPFLGRRLPRRQELTLSRFSQPT